MGNKLLTPIHIEVGERKFHIFPFPAFKCINITGELGAIILPIMAAVIPLFKSSLINDDKDVLDTDISNINVSTVFQNFSGDKLEKLMRELVLDSGNVTYNADDGKIRRLDEDAVNEIFCGEVDGLFILAFEVMRLNFGGFFGRLLTRFGVQEGQVPEMMEKLKNMVSSTPATSLNSN
jgi:hypothetical protein